MAKTRKTYVRRVNFIAGNRSTFGFLCPGCRQLITIGESPVWTEDGFRISRYGTVHELVVCRNTKGSELCDWSGFIQLANQVKQEDLK